MSDLVDVPHKSRVMQLLEQGLVVFPGQRRGILPTIYQLEYPTTKWQLGRPEED